MKRHVSALLVLLCSLTACSAQPSGAPGGDAPAAGEGSSPTTAEGSATTIDEEATITIAGSEDTWPSEGQGAESTTYVYPLNVNPFETLIRLGSDYSLQPALAERWELIEPNTWRFHLRRGVTFHDGSELTADDVMWSWAERQLEGQTLTTVTNTLGPDSVQQVDEYTVDFTPATPNLRLPEQILHPEGAILPRGKHFDDPEPIGTGPFRVVDYMPAEQVTVERYDEYWDEPAQIAGFTVRFLPDPQTRIEALQAGEVDLALDVPASAVPTLESDDRFSIIRAPAGRNQLIYVNISGEAPHDLTAEPAVRHAITRAIDREAYVETVFEGNAEPGRAMAPEAVLGDFADVVEPMPYDPEEARRLLEEAGWVAGDDGIRERDGRRLSLEIIGWAEVSLTAFQLLQAQLADIGIELVIKQAPDQPTYRTFYEETAFDLDLEVPNQNDGNPAFLPVLRMYSESEGTERFAPGGPFDDFAAASLAAQSTAEAQEASAEMMRILINDEAIVIPLAGLYRIYAARDGVELGDPHPSQTSQFWTSLAVSAES